VSGRVGVPPRAPAAHVVERLPAEVVDGVDPEVVTAEDLPGPDLAVVEARAAVEALAVRAEAEVVDLESLRHPRTPDRARPVLLILAVELDAPFGAPHRGRRRVHVRLGGVGPLEVMDAGA